MKYPVLIFKASRDPVNHGALGIARTLGRLGVPVYAIVEDAHTPLAACRYIQNVFVWKNWPADHDAFVSAISAIGAIIGRPTILYPIDDLAAISVAENASRLNGRFLFSQLSATLPRQMANKASFYALCNQMNLPCARSTIPKSDEDVRRFVLQTGFPIVIKPAEQWNTNTLKTNIVHNWEMLSAVCKPEQHSLIILQEYIDGEDWLYNGYSNFEKQLYLGFTGRRLLVHPKDTGSTAIGLSLANQSLCIQAQMLLRAICYSGICDLDWRRDIRDGQYKIIDCNPRIGLNFEMFENAAGIDVARALHLDLSGRKIERAPMIEGRLFIVEHLYLRSVIRGGCPDAHAANARAPALAITRKLAWWRIDDPMPFFVVGMRIGLAAIRRRIIRFFRVTRRLAGRSPNLQ